MVGEKLQRLHLLRADGPSAVQDVVDGLVPRLVHQPAPDKTRVVLELAIPDPPRQRFHQLQLLLRRPQLQHVVRPGLAVPGYQRIADEALVPLRGALPAAGVEAPPVAVILAGDAVDAHIQHLDVRPTGPEPVEGRPVHRRHIPQTMGRPASVNAMPLNISRNRPASSLACTRSPNPYSVSAEDGVTRDSRSSRSTGIRFT